MMVFKESFQEAPCRSACPAHLDIPRYVRAIGEGNFEEALAVVRERLPFPSVCGRICFHPCENACNGNHLLGKGPIAIRDLKRFVAERPEAAAGKRPLVPDTGKRVAVVGAGPAGLTAAYYLRTLGHSVRVFKKKPEPGGMVRFGIPDYRLPKDILADEIKEILETGIELETNSQVDSPAGLLDEGFDAVFVAIGAHKSVKIGIDGEDLPVVLDCLDLMDGLNSGEEVPLGKRVAVVGGGNAAIDAARCALRLGCEEVIVLYRRSRQDMPAAPSEIADALEEGVKIESLTLATGISVKDGIATVACLRTRLGEMDASGRRRPEPIAGSDFELVEVDRVVSAIGQEPDIGPDFGLALGPENAIEVDYETLSTGKQGVFAGGDAVTGPASFIEAVAAGRTAAISIDRYLGGKGEINIEPAKAEERVVQTEFQGFPIGDRIKMPSLPIDDRLKGFAAVEIGFDEGQAVTEAGRCLITNGTGRDSVGERT